MKKVFINCGHCIGVDSGAVNTTLNVTEAELVREIGELVQEYLLDEDYEVMLEQSDNIKGEDNQNWYDSICYHANDWEADICISIHLNAFDKTKTGSECLYISERGQQLGEYILDEIVDLLEIPDRGTKFSSSHWILRYTDMPCVIVEIAFIDNVMDCLLIIDNKSDIARAIAKGIDKYFEQDNYPYYI